MGPLSSPRCILQSISMQNILACKKLQKVWRGYATRRPLWLWGGRLMVSRVVKIQKVMRGYRGRRRAVEQLQRKRANHANKIKGSYFIWQAKKLLRIYRAEHAQKCVLKVQCMYRMRMARARVRAARLMFHNFMALKIGKLARGYLGRRRTKAIRTRSALLFRQMTAIIMRDIQLVTHGHKISLESMSEGNSAAAWTEWDFLDCALFNLLGTNRRDFALEIATALVRKFPDFLIGRFVLQCTLFLTWTSWGKTEFVRQDYLEELVGIMFYNKAHAGSGSIDDYVGASPREKASDKTSLFETTMEEIEFMYFRNAFLRHGKSAVALSSMAVCVLMRMKPETFGENPEDNQQHRLATSRARNLLARSKLVNSANIGESLSRLEVFDNIFSMPHRIVTQADKSFARCRMIGYEAFVQLNPAVKNEFKDMIAANVEIVHCGDMFIIRVASIKLPFTTRELDVMRQRNNVKDLTEMAPKWVMEMENKQKFLSEVIHVRPLVLDSSEVMQLTNLAIAADALKNKISVDLVREKGLSHILAEYLLREMRLVSCRSRLVCSPIQRELSTLRVTIPALEYKRKEGNSLKTMDYSLKLMQRVFRGFRGRSRFRRLRARANEVMRQKELLLKRRDNLLQLRVWRASMASKIQAKVRRFLWRRLMKRLHRAALQIQCAIRIRQARQAVAKVRHRKLMGPEVVEMLRRGVTVGGLDFTLIIYRCGDNYRMAGHDMLRNAIYEGSLHREDVVHLLEKHNNNLNPKALLAGKAKKINLGSYHRVAELIASQLGLATAITALTTPLGALPPGQKKLSLVTIPTAKSSIHNVEKVTNLNRTLKDQQSVVDHYDKLLLARQKKEEGTAKQSVSMRFMSMK